MKIRNKNYKKFRLIPIELDLRNSLSKQFNLYDMCAQQIILYDKTKIKILKDLESKIHITNLKFEYFIPFKLVYGSIQCIIRKSV